MEAKRLWWPQLVLGFLTILLGWLVLARPIDTIISLVVFLGFYLFVSGIFSVIMSFFGIGKEGSAWGWELLAGIFSLIAGLVVLNNALFTSILTPVMFAYVVAFALMIQGGVRMFAGRKDLGTGNYIWSWGGMFLGLLYFLFGAYLLAAPTQYTVAVTVRASGWFAIIIGIMTVVYAFVDRSESKSLA